MKLYVYLFLLVLIWACNPDATNTIQQPKLLHFNTKMPSVKPRYFGSLTEGEKELIYFIDATTTKIIRYFDTAGNEVFNTPLNELSDIGEAVFSVSIKNRDTITALTSYTNRIVHINKQGRIFNQFLIDTIIPTVDSNSKYVLFSSIYCDIFTQKNTVLLTQEWRYNFSKEQDDTLTLEEHMTKFYFNKWHFPYLLKIDNIFDITNSKYKFGLNLEQILFPNDSIMLKDSSFIYLNYHNYANINSYTYVKSKYSNKMFKVNSDLEIEDTIILTSKYTKIGAPRLNIKKVKHYVQQAFDNNTLNGASKDLMYNNNIIYHIVYTKITPEFYKEKGYRPWVLQEYDTNFKLLKETPFFDNEYAPKLLGLKDGVYIEKVSTTEINNYNGHYVTFEKYSH